MQGFVVALRKDGLFEAAPSAPGRATVRIIHDGMAESAPWTVIAPDETGVKWAPFRNFESLDQALDCAAGEAFGLEANQEYSVSLPDGTRFKRPGRIGAEQVMASAGWVYVVGLIGFSMLTTSSDANVFDARTAMRRRIAGTNLKLGEVSLADSDEDGLHWCADLTLAWEGFIRLEDIEMEAKAAFAAEGVEVIPHFDFKLRTSLSLSEALVIPFPTDRVRKSSAA